MWKTLKQSNNWLHIQQKFWRLNLQFTPTCLNAEWVWSAVNEALFEALSWKFSLKNKTNRPVRKNFAKKWTLVKLGLVALNAIKELELQILQ